MKLYLCGMPGSGKTTCGPLLAKQLGLHFFDTDKIVGDGRKILVEQGVDAFHEREAEAVMSLPNSPCVVALGGSSLESEEVCDMVKGHHVVFLHCPLDILWKRLEASPRVRIPDTQTLHDFAQQRMPTFNRMATFAVDIADKTPQQIVDEIGAYYGQQ